MQIAALLLLILACALLGILWMLRQETIKRGPTVWVRVPFPIKDHLGEWLFTCVAGLSVVFF